QSPSFLLLHLMEGLVHQGTPNYCISKLLPVSVFVSYKKFSVLGSDQPIVADVGEEVVLPCQLSPRMSAVNKTIRWFRDQIDSPVYLYKNTLHITDEQDQAYRGRTTLFIKELENGNVSLGIRNIHASDEGIYNCFVESLKWYEGTQIKVIVTDGLHGSHTLSLKMKEGKGIQLGCKSSGWYPKPEVTWTDGKSQKLTTVSETIETEDGGLFSVNSYVITDDSSHKRTCHIQNDFMKETRESSLQISDVFFPRVSPWLVAFFVLLGLLPVAICIAIYCWRKQSK
uniref:Ig-like domain-containing protein n=1 Tax=Latimeria chalumnae TaxID=7897 RepID=H3AXB8_LATCH